MGASASIEEIAQLFTPESVVLVGASANPQSIGFTVARALIRNFQGPIHYVSPTEAEVFGFPTYASIEAVPPGSHHWIFTIMPKRFLDTLHLICERKPKAILLLMEISASMSLAVKKELTNLSCPLIGPRSGGYYDPETSVDTIILPPEMLTRPTRGGTGLITDNRDVAFGLLEHLSKYRCGVSHFIDLGDSYGTNEADLLNYYVRDPMTRVILLGVGQISQISRFRMAIRRAKRAKKPIIVPLFAPTIINELGLHRRANSKITALTEDLAIQHDLMVTTSWGRAVDLAKLCQWQPLPKGPGIAVVSNFGPYCVNAASSLQASSLELAPLKPETLQTLQDILPPYTRPKNPICLYTNADEVRLDSTLQTILSDPTFDTLILTLLPNSPYIDSDYLYVMLRQRLKRTATQKTFVGVIPSINSENLLIKSLEQLQIPVYSNPHRAVSTLETAYRYATKIDQK